MIKRLSIEVLNRLQERFEHLYGRQSRHCIDRLDMLVGRYGVGMDARCSLKHWDETDSILITYADMVQSHGEVPLETLNDFLTEHVKDVISSVHILPFFPFSSDDGFSVIDYRSVAPENGTWKEIEALQEHFRLMFDLVINHVSRQSSWFKDYVSGIAPARYYFIEMDPATDTSDVVRPRSSPLLTKTQTRDGEKHVWATFSDDQIDLNFANPDVLFAMLDILFFYVSKGAKIIRLDAIAYLWKEIGTSCIHHPKTHEVVRLIRDVLEMVSPDVIIITETNVPHKENISYFGNGHEAHVVYQFSLPPLLLHGLITGNAEHLTQWASSLPALPLGCTFLNFTASHDGIGVRPLENIIPDDEIQRILETVKARGGDVSMKQNSDGSKSPYELNITYFDALGGSEEKPDEHQVARFLCSQTVALGLKGIPAIYFHSLTATANDHEGVKVTGRARSINRKKWQRDELEALMEDSTSCTSHVFNGYMKLLRLRTMHPAFHPNSSQRILHFDQRVFALQRMSMDQKEIIVCLSNFSTERVEVDAKADLSALQDSLKWHDLITGDTVDGKEGRIVLEPYQSMWIRIS